MAAGVSSGVTQAGRFVSTSLPSRRRLADDLAHTVADDPTKKQGQIKKKKIEAAGNYIGSSNAIRFVHQSGAIPFRYIQRSLSTSAL